MLMHLTPFELNTNYKTKLKAHVLTDIYTLSYKKADGLIHILRYPALKPGIINII